MAEQSTTYGLRARKFASKRKAGNDLSAEELSQPAARATIGAGLRPGALTKAERLQFSSRSKAYLEARNTILAKWDADFSTYLPLEACLDGAGDEEVYSETHTFLSEQGNINFGILKGEPQPESQGLSDDDLHCQLVALLKTVDLDEWTEKRIRKELEVRLGESLSEKKAFIREKVLAFLEGDTAAPPPRKKSRSKGKVVVIGAGPAGLAAAMHLKRNGAEVVVLEARDRVGGRVHTHQGGGLSAPVDLGASIITGTEIDTGKGLQPDPSAIIARQLGLEFHNLQPELPLFDGETGAKIGEEQDRRMEVLRDALMDAARARVEELGEAAVASESFGDALERALSELSKEPENGQPRRLESGGLTSFLPSAEGKEPMAEAEAASEPGEGAQEAVKDGAAGEADAPMEASGEAPAEAPAARETGAGPAEPEAAGTEGVQIGGMEDALDRAGLSALVRGMSPSDRRLLDWHWANLEYGCSARLSDVSLAHWNQDEEYGGFGGPHCMLRGGYGQVTQGLASGLDVRLSCPVTSIKASESSVVVTSASGERFEGEAVVVTVPLGCLKAGQITFQPPLPPWKQEAIEKLGFGTLNKIVLEFPEVFWDDSLSYFGAALPGGSIGRGAACIFWNLHPLTGEKQLTALVSGDSAYRGEGEGDKQLRDMAVGVLGTLFPNMPDPSGVSVTRWMADEYSKGSYSYVAVGATAETYDSLAKPVHRRVLFAGEHTCKEHPDTVGGAMLTGMREAIRALRIIRGDREEVASLKASQADTSTAKKRRQVDEGLEGQGKRRKGKDGKRRQGEATADSGDEAVMTGGDGGEPLGQREAAKTADQIRQEMEARESARGEVKTFLRAVMQVSTGQNFQFLSLMDEATDVDAKARLLNNLQRAERVGLAAIGKDQTCMHTLHLWLEDLVADRLATNALDLLLKVLAMIPSDLELLKASGIEKSFQDHLLTHPTKHIRLQSERMAEKWGLEKPTALAKPTATAKPKNSAAAQPPPAEYDSEYENEMEQLRQDKAEAERLAREFQEQAAALEEELQQEDGAQLPSIDDFDSFSKQSGRKKAKPTGKAREDKLARRRERALKALAAADKSTSKPSEKTQTSSQPSSNGKSASNGMKAASGQFLKPVDVISDFVNSLLTPAFKSHKITKDQYKAISRKVVKKVLDNQFPSRPFEMNDKERGKMRAMVEKYIALSKAGKL